MKKLGLFSFLLLAALSPAQAAELSLNQPPGNYKLDGLLNEWTMPPQLQLGPENQVRIKAADKPDKAGSFGARFWLAQDAKGFYLAGQVQDDKVLLPRSDKPLINSDHVELWLAYPQLQLPVLGFVNQFAEVSVKSEADCNQEEVADAKDCLNWYQAQQKRRQLLSRLFTRQYLFNQAWSEEQWFMPAYKKAAVELPSEILPSGDSQVKYRPAPQGYTFEAWIPAEQLPLVAGSQLNQFKLSLDIVDNDKGYERQEHFYSSSAGPAHQPKYGQSASFQNARLTQPLKASQPEPSALELLKRSGVAFKQGSELKAFAFYNPAMGYQYSPTEDSPYIESIKLPRLPVLSWQNLDFYRRPDNLDYLGVSQEIISTRQGRLTGVLKPQTRCAYAGEAQFLQSQQGDVMLGAMVCEGLASPFASGMCGACPVIFIDVFAVNAAGKMVSLDAIENMDDLSSRENLQFNADPHGQGFSLSYTASVPESECSEKWIEKAVEQKYLWSDYLTKARELLLRAE